MRIVFIHILLQGPYTVAIVARATCRRNHCNKEADRIAVRATLDICTIGSPNAKGVDSTAVSDCLVEGAPRGGRRPSKHHRIQTILQAVLPK